MSNNNSDDKHRQPDAYISVEQQNRNGTKKLVEVGAVWNGKDGYQTGDSVFGPLVIQSREAREALQSLRADRKKTVDVDPQPKHGQEH